MTDEAEGQAPETTVLHKVQHQGLYSQTSQPSIFFGLF